MGSSPTLRAIKEAGVAELADAQDLKSCGGKTSCRFDSGPRHQIAGWSSLEARRAHNPEVVGSNPTPASIITLKLKWPHGQAVKTSPFHGGIPGSSPGGVTKK